MSKFETDHLGAKYGLYPPVELDNYLVLFENFWLRVRLCRRTSRHYFSICPLGSDGEYRRASESFLFSLVNSSGLPPTKMPLIAGQEGCAIYCDSSCGAVFGGGHDLCIPNAPDSNNCYTSLNTTYQCPAGQDPTTFLAGNETFLVSEIEVFGFEKYWDASAFRLR